jgi:hypothetical protein
MVERAKEKMASLTISRPTLVKSSWNKRSFRNRMMENLSLLLPLLTLKFTAARNPLKFRNCPGQKKRSLK